MEAFNASLQFDRRMWQADITGSQAYAKALEKVGILTAAERDQLVEGLEKVGQEWASNTFEIKPSDEDIHTANERRLGELVGSVAGKLHTGRSRNDQVATDMRLWLREQATALLTFLKDLIGIAVARAEKEIDAIMPGYTHLQVCAYQTGAIRSKAETKVDVSGCAEGSTDPMESLVAILRMELAYRCRTFGTTYQADQ